MKEIRIIGGKARGRRIKSVPGDTTRPITDKVRQALFNILGSDIQDSTILDLFAGTGSVGIEALSRGARSACFVDVGWQAYKTIRENLILTDLDVGAQVIRSDAFTFLEHTHPQSFNYIYIAPPQYKELWIRALQTIDTNINWLSDDAWVIVQIHPIEYKPIGEELPINNLVEFDQRHYGSTVLVFYRKVKN